MTERQARDEGAEQTKRIAGAMKQLRTLKGWSAAQLAAEMTEVNVPWNADIVVNLEHGRRRSLRVHELLALAVVLDVAKPVDDLLIPGEEPFPVVPALRIGSEDARAWFRGERGPLRLNVPELPSELITESLEAAAQLLDQQGRHEDAAKIRSVTVRPGTLGGGGDGQD